MDACDAIMQKIGLAEGLIRMDSEAGIAEGKPFRFTPRIIGYSVILVVLLGFIFSMLIFRSDIETTVLRTPGVLYQQLPNNKISNLYNIKMINKTNKEIKVKLKLLSGVGEVKLVGKDLVIAPQGTGQTSAFIILNKSDVLKMKTNIQLGVYSEDKELETIGTTFIGPIN
jgi:polyferredoxin